MPTLVQIFHRSIAYVLTGLILVFFWRAKQIKVNPFQLTNQLLITMLVIQFLLGVFTIINCKGTIPVGLGSLHQGGAIILLSISLFVNYLLSRENAKA